MTRTRLTNEITDSRIYNRNFKRLDGVVNNKTKIRWQCLTCDHIWSAKPSNVFLSKVGCPKCSKNAEKLTNDDIDRKLIMRNLERIDDIINCKTSITFRCKQCNHTWKTKPYNVLGKNKSGCPKCANRIPLTNSAVDERLSNRTIKRVGPIKNSSSATKVQCTICNYTWETTPKCFLHKFSGCPKCVNIVSKRESKWLDGLEIPNTPQHRQVTLKIGNKWYKVDGYIPETNTVYEFWGRFWHGDPSAHEANKINPVTKTTYAELYIKTQEKRQAILNAGYKLVETWG